MLGKRTILVMAVVFTVLLLLLCACDTGTMYIKLDTLTREEESYCEIAQETLGQSCEGYAYQVATDDSVSYMEVRTYELKDGQWNERAVLGREEELTAGKHRVYMAFDRLPAGIVVQTGSFANSFQPELSEDISDLEGCGIVGPSRAEIVPGEEIPLVVECYGLGASVEGCELEDFFSPEDLAVKGYDYVNAVTIYFE